MVNNGFQVSSDCGQLQQSAEHEVSLSASTASATSISFLETSIAKACVKDQLSNDDFQDCKFQQERHCPEGGEWLRYETIDTRQESRDPVRSDPFCSGNSTGTESSEGFQEPDLDDLSRLVPYAPPLHADNGGRGIRRAHTNFYTDAFTLIHQSTTDGQTTLIRATPIEYHWDYGDGTTRTTEVAGSSQSEFNVETATSHQYEETGTYTVTLSTVYMGEYSLDGGQTWIPIDGTITRESDPLQADIFRTVTRNVADDCVENPSAWGCGAPGEDSDPAG